MVRYKFLTHSVEVMIEKAEKLYFYPLKVAFFLAMSHAKFEI